jgi:energy-coupling factor transporter ATP-binding protein EcfA2/uncharacterized membrane protein
MAHYRDGLSIAGLTFQYAGTAKTVLSDVSLHIPKGAFYLLCGTSGCGKSTLLRCVAPSMTPHGRLCGDLTWNGTAIHQMDSRTQTQCIGYVQQDPDYQIVTDKVWHELAFGLESMGYASDVIRRRVAEMASFFGIQHWFHKSVQELSGGQKQLLNLASVMVLQPDILILDEPTSQLDPIAAGEFLNMLVQLNRELGVTILLAEHRLEEAMPLATHIAVLDNGHVIYEGAPAEVGRVLYDKKHPMYMAMPCAVQVWNALSMDYSELCPVTVTEGKQWLSEYVCTHTPIQCNRTDTEFISDAPVVLSAQEVWFRYEKNGADIVKSLSLQIRKGEFTAILGGNGTGKTTALKLLAGLYTPYRGKLIRNGSIALLPQNPQTLFVKNTVAEDLLEVLDRRTITEFDAFKQIITVAERCRIAHLLNKHPYDLSGGEQERAALAKILLLNPDILLLDEPTKGCDGAFKQVLADILQDLQQSGITILMVSHDIEFCAKYAERCMMFFDGNIIAEDTANAFFSGNYFYTTAANRMAKHILPQAVLTEDIITAFRKDYDIGNYIDRKEESSYTEVQQEKEIQAEEQAKTNAIVSNMERYTDRHTGNTLITALCLLVLVPVTVWLGYNMGGARQYYVTAILVLLECMIPCAALFEWRKPLARELVIISVLCAIAIAGRAVFFMFPQIKPVLAVVILSGVALGCETGALVGAITMLVSNLLFAQGPWTPWQMFAMGLVGGLAGLLFCNKPWKKNRPVLCIFGGISAVVLYGVIMNVSTAVLYNAEPNAAIILAYLISGFPMDCMHGIATALFLWLLSKPILEKLDRIQRKYGCFYAKKASR